MKHIPIIKSWVHRKRYSIAEDEQGQPVGLLIPVPIVLHYPNLKTSPRGNMGLMGDVIKVSPSHGDILAKYNKGVNL